MDITLTNYTLITNLIRDNDREGLEAFLEPIKLTFNERSLLKHSTRLIDIVPAMIRARPNKELVL